MTDQVFAAVAILQNEDGLFLAVNRKGGHPDDLGFPGGKLNKGEFPQNAATRELWEETGILALHAATLLVTTDEDNHVTSAHVILAKMNQPSEREPGIIPRWATEAELTSDMCSYANFNRLCFQRLRWPKRA